MAQQGCLQIGFNLYTLQIYRSFEIGKLIKLIMLDTRIIGRSLQNISAVNVSPYTIRDASYTLTATPAACSCTRHPKRACSRYVQHARRHGPASSPLPKETARHHRLGMWLFLSLAAIGVLQDPSRTILGAPQKAFLQGELLAAEGKQRWKVLGQQVRCRTTCTLKPIRLQAYRACTAPRCT